MAEETRVERRLDRVIDRAISPRSAAVVIAVVTTSITIAAGFLMTIIDRDNFPSLGAGMWWAVQTVTTVGYGDIVPVTTAGRFVAAMVMLLGIGFVTVITAAITSSFVAGSRQQQAQPASDHHDASLGHLRAIDERLERIEAALSRHL